jgi:hypothetical protein
MLHADFKQISRGVSDFDVHAFAVKGHRPAHGSRPSGHICERKNGAAVTADSNERGRGERKLFSFRVPGGGGCQGMAAGRSGIVEGCAEPVGGYVGVRAGVLFDGDGARSMVNGEYQPAT